MCENEDAPRVRQGERAGFLKEHPELVPAGKLRRKGLCAPCAALVYNCNAHEYQPWCDPAKAVPLPDEELERRREARRAAEMRRHARLRCPACGRAVAKTLRDARAACLRDGLWHEEDDRVILCPECRRERDEARERARRIALEERRAALAPVAKEPVPRVAGPLPKTIVLDTETTGLRGWSDHLLTVGIVDGEGVEVARFEICPPAECFEWPEAEEVNGIAPADTVAWPAIEDVVPELQRILDAAETVIGYNVGFDLEFLSAAGVALPDCRYVDVMARFAPVFGLRDDYHGGYRWQTLATAAAYVGHDWGAEGPHDALADCRAALAVLRWPCCAGWRPTMARRSTAASRARDAPPHGGGSTRPRRRSRNERAVRCNERLNGSLSFRLP